MFLTFIFDHVDDRNIFMRTKKDNFIPELFKSGPFILLIFLALLIFLGMYLSNRQKDAVYMKEEIMYISPKSQ